MLDHRAGGQVAALGGGLRRTARQALRQIAGAERVARRGGIDDARRIEAHRRHINQRVVADRHQTRVRAALNHDFAGACGAGALNHCA